MENRSTNSPAERILAKRDDGVPLTVIARRIGIHRNKLYSFLSPAKYRSYWRPNAEDFSLIAAYTRFSVKRTIEDYESRLAGGEQ